MQWRHTTGVRQGPFSKTCDCDLIKEQNSGGSGVCTDWQFYRIERVCSRGDHRANCVACTIVHEKPRKFTGIYLWWKCKVIVYFRTLLSETTRLIEKDKIDSLHHPKCPKSLFVAQCKGHPQQQTKCRTVGVENSGRLICRLTFEIGCHEMFH